MITIRIDVIPHAEQRYDTVGDWRVLYEREGSIWQLDVSETGNWKYNYLIALHELIEMGLCVSAKIDDRDVDHFDIEWEPHDNIEEPGDDPEAPYYRQHQIACAIERAVALHLDVKWPEYEAALDKLEKDSAH